MNNEFEMYVICFYWQGDRWQGKEYRDKDERFKNLIRQAGTVSNSLASRYVENLYRGVERFASKPFKFICFTNENLEVSKDIELRNFPLITKMGVLPRIYMFSEAAGLFGKQVLCLDIDNVITGDLTDIMNYDGIYAARGRFLNNETHLIDGDIQSFQANKLTERLFYTPFADNIRNAENKTKGRERYWVRNAAGKLAGNLFDIAPNQIFSYKHHIRKNVKLLKNARIVSFHGYPRPHQLLKKETWIKEYWK